MGAAQISYRYQDPEFPGISSFRRDRRQKSQRPTPARGRSVRIRWSTASRAGRALKIVPLTSGAAIPRSRSVCRYPASAWRGCNCCTPGRKRALPSRRARFGRAGHPARCFSVGMQMDHGRPGWYPIEQFAGEIFYWMKQKAEIVWLPPRNATPAFSALHVEPGPAAGFGVLCDVNPARSMGRRTIADAHRQGPQSQVLDPDWGPMEGLWPISFEIRGGTPGAAVPGDSRGDGAAYLRQRIMEEAIADRRWGSAHRSEIRRSGASRPRCFVRQWMGRTSRAR